MSSLLLLLLLLLLPLSSLLLPLSAPAAAVAAVALAAAAPSAPAAVARATVADGQSASEYRRIERMSETVSGGIFPADVVTPRCPPCSLSLTPDEESSGSPNASDTGCDGMLCRHGHQLTTS